MGWATALNDLLDVIDQTTAPADAIFLLSLGIAALLAILFDQRATYRAELQRRQRGKAECFR